MRPALAKEEEKKSFYPKCLYNSTLTPALLDAYPLIHPHFSYNSPTIRPRIGLTAFK